MTATERLKVCGGVSIDDVGDGSVLVRAWATPGAPAPGDRRFAQHEISRPLKTAAEGIRVHAIIEAMAEWCLEPSEERLNAAMR